MKTLVTSFALALAGVRLSAMTGPLPRRGAPVTVPLSDFEALQRERDGLQRRLDAFTEQAASRSRWAAGLRVLWRGLVGLVLLAGVCWLFNDIVLGGRASGLRARQNAETEAVRYITRTRGVSPTGVSCAAIQGGSITFDMTCTVSPTTLLHAQLRCDSDEPARSDGCSEVSP